LGLGYAGRTLYREADQLDPYPYENMPGQKKGEKDIGDRDEKAFLEKRVLPGGGRKGTAGLVWPVRWVGGNA